MADETPRVWVQLQVVYPPELGGRIITKRIEASVDEYLPGQGRGVDAMIDHVSRAVKDETRKPR